MISYLIESTLCLALLYGFYWLALCKMKLLQLNRIYLLSMVLLSYTIPALEIPIAQTDALAVGGLFTAGTELGELVSLPATPKSTFSLPLIIYLSGLLVAILLFTKQILRPLQLARGTKTRWGNYWLVQTKRDDFSSFLHYIFVPEGLDPKSEEARAPLAHEAVHLDQSHSLDLLVVNFIHCLFWFNPIFIALKKSLKLQHEYIADDVVSRNLGHKQYSQRLVELTLVNAGLPLTHSFSQHPVEKRLKMIETLNPTNMKKFKRLSLSIPIMVILILSISCVETKYIYLDNQGETEEITKEEYQKLLNQDPSEAQVATEGKSPLYLSSQAVPKLPTSIKGKVQAGQTGNPLNDVLVIKMPAGMNGTMTNKSGDYVVAMTPADTSLIFRKKGYKDMHIPRMKFSVINVALQEKLTDKKGED